MISLFCDLHVHTGRALGKPVKITAGAALTVGSAIVEAASRKGLGILGLADAAAGPVLETLCDLLERGMLEPKAGGGYLASLPPNSEQGTGSARPLVVPASETEVLVCGRPVHTLALLPDLAAVRALRLFLAGRVRNPDLGCQRAHGLELVVLSEFVRSVGGLFGLAHAFTPHRGFYGSTESTMREALGAVAAETLDFVEMGLSADTGMADLVSELRQVPLIACSDAHSCATIAREATLVRVAAASYTELVAAIRGLDGRGIEAVYGLDPRLGKYHRSACRRCGWVAGAAADGPGPNHRCPHCADGGDVVFGVLDRVLEIAHRVGSREPAPSAPVLTPAARPPYHHHVPLRFIPGIGRRTYDRLLPACGSELAAMHSAPYATLAAAVGEEIAGLIVASRQGLLFLEPGGGGKFGRVSHISARSPE